MPKTERIYYIDSYLTKLESKVVSTSDDKLRLTLDRSHFYPTSGGQPHDVGTLNGITVKDVVDEGESVVHVLASPLAESSVEGEISWVRRYDHMQQHTGQHLLSAVFAQLYGMPTLSFHMGPQVSTIELGTKELTTKQIEAVALRATELARANPAIVVSFEDAALAEGLRKASDRGGVLRIVQIPGIDRSACGGTHVAALAEVLPLQIRELDKVRGNVRAAFVCGNRALFQMQSDFNVVSRVALALGVSQDRVESQMIALKQNLTETEKQKLRLETEVAHRAGLDLYLETKPDDDGMRRLETAIDEKARVRARAFASQPRSVVLLHSAEGVLLACSADSGLNAGVVLKQALEKYGARGGGSATLAQGSLPDAAMLVQLRKLVGLG